MVNTKLVVTDVMLLLLMAVSVYTDLRQGKIYNCVTFPVMGAGLLVNVWFHKWDGLERSLIGLAVGCGVLLVPFMVGGVGAGDVKFCAAMGAIKGADVHFWNSFPFWAFLYGAVVGGVISLVGLTRRRLGWSSFSHLLRYLYVRFFLRAPINYTPLSQEAKMPYAVSLSLGCLIAIMFEIWWQGRAYPMLD